MYKGEFIALATAISWTACAVMAEVASKRMGSLALNVIRMALSLIMLLALMWIYTGVPFPAGADNQTWTWLLLSGLVGYVIGDYCLFSCYILIGSRFGQLLMTLAPIAAAFTGWLMLGETMGAAALAGMVVTMAGIALSLSGKKDTPAGKLPVKGIVFGVIAGICQGVGLVLSAKGLVCYDASLSQMDVTSGIDVDRVRDLIPFSSTAIRAVIGLVGFTVWSLVIGHGKDIVTGLKDRKGMLAALGATITGPFLGVSLSLMATIYTNTGVAQTIMALTPVLIIFPTWILFHQKITLREILGSIVAVAGVSLFFV